MQKRMSLPGKHDYENNLTGDDVVTFGFELVSDGHSLWLHFLIRIKPEYLAIDCLLGLTTYGTLRSTWKELSS
jgi:hypothetical protein